MKASIAFLLSVSIVTGAEAQTRPLPNLASATIEDLMKILVTTASRESQGLGDAPARVQVVTAAQIERRGYRSVLDVLKDLADFTVDLAGDQDYPAQLAVQGVPIGSPQNPRRVSVGFSLRVL